MTPERIEELKSAAAGARDRKVTATLLPDEVEAVCALAKSAIPSGQVAADTGEIEYAIRAAEAWWRKDLPTHRAALTRLATRAQGYEAIRSVLADVYGTDGEPLERVRRIVRQRNRAEAETAVEQEERHRVEMERDREAERAGRAEQERDALKARVAELEEIEHGCRAYEAHLKKTADTLRGKLLAEEERCAILAAKAQGYEGAVEGLADVTEVLVGERPIGIMPGTTLDAARRVVAERDAAVAREATLQRTQDELVTLLSPYAAGEEGNRDVVGLVKRLLRGVHRADEPEWTMRDAFARAAMQAFIAHPEEGRGETLKSLAARSYAVADVMLEASGNR